MICNVEDWSDMGYVIMSMPSATLQDSVARDGKWFIDRHCHSNESLKTTYFYMKVTREKYASQNNEERHILWLWRCFQIVMSPHWVSGSSLSNSVLPSVLSLDRT